MKKLLIVLIVLVGGGALAFCVLSYLDWFVRLPIVAYFPDGTPRGCMVAENTYEPPDDPHCAEIIAGQHRFISVGWNEPKLNVKWKDGNK